MKQCSICGKYQINFHKYWHAPTKLQTLVIERGIDNWEITCNFSGSTLSSLAPIMNPKYTSCCLPNSHSYHSTIAVSFVKPLKP